MKQLKFLMVALTLLMGVSLTSCLNSDSDYVQQIPIIAKVYNTYGSYTFKTNDGYTITPTMASVSACETAGIKLSEMAGKIAYIIYTADGLVLNETTKTLDGVTLVGALSLDNKVAVVPGKEIDKLPQDSIANSPILSLEANNGKPMFMDATSILLPVHYTVKKNENYVTLVYYTDEPEDNGDVLRLHLRLNTKGKDTGYSYTSYDYSNNGYIGLYLKAYDLTSVFMTYLQKKGMTPSAANYPKKIEIVTQENSYSTDLTDSQTKEKVYTVEYKTTSAE